jgi:hypothetical protein
MPPSASATSEVNMTNQNEAILSRFKDLPCKVAKAFFIIIVHYKDLYSFYCAS